MTHNFYELRMIAGLSRTESATLFNVTLRTVKNWENGKTEPPRAVFLFLLLRNGDLSFLGKNWRGFYLSKDCIESPDGNFIYWYECDIIKYLYQAADKERFRMARIFEQQKDISTEKVINFRLKAVS